METKKKGVVIACGGTGGHLFPGIAVAEELVKRGHPVILLISEKKIDAQASQGYTHLRFEQLPSVAMPKPWSPKMIPFLLRFTRGLRLTRKLIKEIDAACVLGMGGFTSTAPLMAGRWAKCHGLIHESNAIPGRANRLNARYADFALVGWEACAKYFASGKARVVGTPVRPAFFNLPDKRTAREKFGLNPDLFTVLVMGGSQGARGINDAVCAALPELEQAGKVQFLHFTGRSDLEAVQNAYAERNLQHHVAEFCSQMELAYAASDLSVCRSGASSLTEMSVVGLPGILVPYPHAADDHQTRNAEVFVAQNACLMAKQEDLTGPKLASIIGDLAADPARLNAMAVQMKQMSPHSAAEQVADIIEDLTK